MIVSDLFLDHQLRLLERALKQARFKRTVLGIRFSEDEVRILISHLPNLISLSPAYEN